MSRVISSNRRISRTENMWPKLQSPTAKIGSRHIQILLIHLGFICAYAMKVIPSITLVAMTKPDSYNPNIPNFHWSESIQNVILSSFFWGFTLTQIPGAELAQRYGAAPFLCFAIGICGILTTLIPIAAVYGGWQSVIAIRTLSGVLQGVIPPTTHILLSQLVPVEERGRAASCVYAGGPLGNVVALLSCGALSKSVFGWPSCFYIWGGIPIVWAVLYYFIGKQSPSAHPTPISKGKLIKSNLGVTKTKTLKTPWTSIFTSTPFWGLLITQCADAWCYWLLFAKVPTYMAYVLDYNIVENGIVSAAPWMMAGVMSIPNSFIYDKLIQRGCLSLSSTRKLANSIGQYGPACALIGFSFIDREHRTIAVIILLVYFACNCSIISGYLINHMDISPTYAGSLMGITTTAGNLAGILAPLICGVIVTDVTDKYQWRRVLLLSAGIFIVGNTTFVLIGDVKVQPWDDASTHGNVNDRTLIDPMLEIVPEKTDDGKNTDKRIADYND